MTDKHTKRCLTSIAIREIKIKITMRTLTHVAQLIGHCPAKQKVTGSIPGQGKWPGLQVWSPVWDCTIGN